MERDYMLALFVEEERDLVGLVAYSLYQRAKREYICEHRRKTSTDPDSSEIEAFRLSHTTPCMIDAYRTQADRIVLEAIGGIVVSQIENEYQSLLSEYQKNIREAVKPLVPSIWNTLLLGILSAFLFALIGAAFGFIKIHNIWS